MMQGVVNPDLEATLPVQVFGPTGQIREIVAVIDTGYSGALSLPMAVITALALSPLSSRVVRLADRTTRVPNTYEAEVLWDGQRRTVRVLTLEGDPLIGTALLNGYTLEATFVDGGAVTIEARP
jgi:clan AA aspartic protease